MMMQVWSCLLHYSMHERKTDGSGIARAPNFAVTSMQIADCQTTQTETHGQFIPVRQPDILPPVIQGRQVDTAISVQRRPPGWLEP
jgi:hypothetical protein